MMTRQPEITIRFERPESEEAQSLIRQLDEDLFQRYPTLQATHGLRSQDLSDPAFTFLIAWTDGVAIGCGALRVLEPGVSEVKRMFVVPQFRGRGIARRILEALESRARELGHALVRLETGQGQPEAIGLYRSAGYREIDGFGEYADNPFSVCFEKRLL
jgi:GNAT superfamily N-acetyltransferase